jgi:hypothetical protein
MPINLSGSLELTGSLVVTGGITMSGSIASSSFAINASTASSADNLLVRNTLTAQTLVVQTITSSVDFVTGSTRFGSIADNTHQFTGSVSISGSLNGFSAVFSGGLSAGGVAISSNSNSFYNTATETSVAIKQTSNTNQIALSLWNDATSGDNRFVRFFTEGTATVRGGIQYDRTGNRLSIFGLGSGLYFDGAATFSSSITAASANFSGNVIFNRASTSAGNNIEWRTANTLNWYIGTRGLVDNNFYFVNEGLGANNLILNASSGAATFSSSVTAVQGIFRNSGVPAIQAIRDLNVVAVGAAGQGIEFGALNGATPTAGAAIYGSLDNPATTGALVFQTLTGGSLTTKLTIASTGAATFASTISSTGATFSGDLNLSGAAEINHTGRMLFDAGAGNGFLFRCDNVAVTAMTITSAGNILVGSTSIPSGATEFNNGSLFTSNNIFVNNSNGTSGYAVRLDGFANNLYILWSNGSGTDQGGVGLGYGATSWSPVSSDARTKKNFETTQGLAEILQIEPIKYHLLSDEDNAVKRLGFKAQNLKPLIPEMVYKTGKKLEDGSDILTITPDYILPVLVKAIQELTARVQELENK